MTTAFDSVTFRHGPALKNRFMLAPLTNTQSNVDGTLSDEEFRWLSMRAEGGFGLTMTCAAHVMPSGQAFPGQLGCWSDDHLPGLSRLARAINHQGSLSVVQLHHGGRRAVAEFFGGDLVAPSDDAKTGARALTSKEIDVVVDAFVAAAVRVERAGFHGAEIHGAHDYLLCEFLNPELNVRTDEYGGSVQNRLRIFTRIIDGIRSQTGPDFNLSVRLSCELFGLVTADIIEAYRLLLATEQLDFIDLSLWDAFKTANDEVFAGRALLDLFLEIPRGETRLAVAGKIYSGADVDALLAKGVDMIVLGRAAITNHDFPNQYQANRSFAMRELPVPRATLVAEGLSDRFITYMSNWAGFVGE